MSSVGEATSELTETTNDFDVTRDVTDDVMCDVIDVCC